jgi:hypothetical protein
MPAVGFALKLLAPLLIVDVLKLTVPLVAVQCKPVPVIPHSPPQQKTGVAINFIFQTLSNKHSPPQYQHELLFLNTHRT